VQAGACTYTHTLMATYTSPVSLSDFKAYLKDTTTDTALLAFYQSLLDTATEHVYTWLDRDFTASATKTDRFWGDNSQFYAPHDQAGAITSWTTYDENGASTSMGTTDLFIRRNGFLIAIKSTSTKTFESGFEHKIVYTTPSTLTCPETVKQVITEIAAELLRASNQGDGTLGVLYQSTRDGALGYDGGFSQRARFLDLNERHKEMLRVYKRYPI
jgi:hypothetical protein